MALMSLRRPRDNLFRVQAIFGAKAVASDITSLYTGSYSPVFPIKPPPPSLSMVSPNLPSLLSSSIPRSKRTSDPSVLMTITLEPLVRLSPANGKETILVSRPVPPQPRATQSDQPLNSTPARATNLLQSFIEAYKEVESFRYVRRDWSCSWHVLKHIPLQKWKFDPRRRSQSFHPGRHRRCEVQCARHPRRFRWRSGASPAEPECHR